jgi:hypothetical protein
MNVFSSGGGVNGFNPSLIGGTGTTAKIFPSLLGTGFDNGGGALPTPGAATAAFCQIPAGGQYEQQLIEVRASGNLFVHGTSPTVQIVFQQGSSMTSTSNTTMATLSAALSVTTASTYPWSFTCKLQGDSDSGIMQIFDPEFHLNGVAGAFTSTLTDLTGVNFFTTTYPFVFGITFAVSDALNKAKLSQFQFGT